MSDDLNPGIRREKLLLGGATVFISVLPIALLAASVPLAVLVRRHGTKAGITTAIISSGVALLLSLNPLVFVQVLLVLALGIAIGEGLKERLSIMQIIIGGAAISIVSTLLMKITVESVIGQPLDQHLVEFWQEVLRNSGGSGTQIPPDSVAEMVAQMRAIFPASLVIGSVTLTVINIALATRFLKRLPPMTDDERNDEKAFEPLPPFGLWRFHKGVSVAFVIGWILSLSDRRSGLSMAGDLGLSAIILSNVMLVIGTLVTVHGMAVGLFFLRKAGLSSVLSAVIMLMALFMPVMPSLLLITGLIDSWVDLRRVNQGVLDG